MSLCLNFGVGFGLMGGILKVVAGPLVNSSAIVPFCSWLNWSVYSVILFLSLPQPTTLSTLRGKTDEYTRGGGEQARRDITGRTKETFR